MISILVIIALVTISIFFVTGFPGSATKLGWKLSGIWKNQSDTLQIMFHEHKSYLQGHVVSADLIGKNEKIVIGKKVVEKLKLQSMWAWSTGRYIDPYTMEEFEFKVKLKGNNRLKVCYMENKNLVKKEEWTLVNSL